MADRVVHIIDVGTNKASIILPDLYSAIAADVGVTKKAADTPGAPRSSVRALLSGGMAARLRVSYVDGTKRRTANILCAADKLDTAPGAIVGKTYGSFTIKTAYFPSRQRLG